MFISNLKAEEQSILKKWIWVTIGTLVSVAVLGIGGWWLIDHYHYQQLVDQPTDVKKWQADPRPLQSESEAQKRITEIRQPSSSVHLAKKTKMAVIPGLRGTWSMDNKTRQAAFGTNWVPQGVTQSKKALYVSMYDGDHRLNSIIIEIDAKTGRYNKTLILRSKAHVGGITYDLDKQRLLWSDDNSKAGGAGISYAAQREIDAYQPQVNQAPLASTRIPFHLADRTSAMTLYNHQLVLVKYGKKTTGRSLIALPLNDENLPNAITQKQFDKIVTDLAPQTQHKSTTQMLDILFKTLIKKKIINSYNPAWDRLQGVAIAKDGVTLFSQSNGSAPGKIWIRMAVDKGWEKLDFKSPKAGDKMINVPNSVEEISFNPDQNELLLIFESGAKAYREEGWFFHRPHYMDRIMYLPLTV